MYERSGHHGGIRQIGSVRVYLDVIKAPGVKLPVCLLHQFTRLLHDLRLGAFPQLGSVGFDQISLVLGNKNLNTLQAGSTATLPQLPNPFAD